MNEWHGRPTKFKKGDIITLPTGAVVLVESPTRGTILGIMGKIPVQIQDDPNWKLVSDGN